MSQPLLALLWLSATSLAGAATLAPRTQADMTAAIAKPPSAAPTPKPTSGPTCSLVTPEGPRGGRLEIEGKGFGQAPLVRIGGKVTRMIERTETRIAVQIPADSNGGNVTVSVGKVEVSCGTLTIIGRD